MPPLAPRSLADSVGRAPILSIPFLTFSKNVSVPRSACGYSLHRPTQSQRSRRVVTRYRQDEGPNTTATAGVASVVDRNAAPALAIQARAQLLVIGLGTRGISAVNRLIASGSLPEAEFWALDSDKRALAAVDGRAKVLEVAPGDDASLDPTDLAALSGEAVSAAAPDAPDGHAGAVFVLGSAFGSPGGAPMLLQLVRHLRRQGYFVATALTRPFEFEGARRLEAADALINTMNEVAHLVVVIAQGVLTRAFAELTMAQAQAIADNTLVYTVQSTLWALRAPEVLKVTRGAFLWHGRDLRNIKRPLFPPMMNLLSCPGHAALGRGQAALPSPLLQQAGLASVMSTLAEDAVRAATDSPFLDNKLEGATGVLCVLRVPPSALGVLPTSGSLLRSGPLVADNHKEYALRSAVQVAAMTVRELVGPRCHDIIVCPQLCPDMEEEEGGSVAHPQQQRADPHAGPQGTGDEADAEGAAAAADEPQQARQPLIRVEVSLLVLEAMEEAAEATAVAGQRAMDPSATAAAAFSGRAPAPATAAAVTAAHAADAAAATPTAATARDRMSTAMGSGAPGSRRLPPPGAASIFSSQAPRPQQPQLPPQPSPTAPAGPTPAPAQTRSGSVTRDVINSVGSLFAAAARSLSGQRTGAHAKGSHANAARAGGSSGSIFSVENGRGSLTRGSPPAANTHSIFAAVDARTGSPARGPANAAATGSIFTSNGRASSVGGSKYGSTTAAPPPSAPAASGATSLAAQKAARLAAMSALAGGTAAPVPAGGSGGSAGQVQAQGPASGRGLSSAMLARSQAPSGGAVEDSGAASAARDGGGALLSGLQQIPRMAESLVTSLVAQSLDLPPQAARWRHQHRVPPPGSRGAVYHLPRVEEELLELEGGTQGEGLGRGLQQFLTGILAPGPGGEGGEGGAAASGRAAMRSRVAGMLDRERDVQEGWGGSA